MKNIPNIITVIRMAMSLSLLFIPALAAEGGLNPVFMAVYIAAGLTDLTDGFIARKMKCVSRLGGRLDVAADAVLFFVLLVKLAIYVSWQPWLICCTAGVLGLRLLCTVLQLIKFKKLVWMNTYLNRIAGFTIFLAPFSCLLFGTQTAALIAVICTSIGAIEEAAIIITSKQFDKWRRSIFFARIQF